MTTSNIHKDPMGPVECQSAAYDINADAAMRYLLAKRAYEQNRRDDQYQEPMTAGAKAVWGLIIVAYGLFGWLVYALVK